MFGETIEKLGFQFSNGLDVQGRLSISDLFPKSKNRCGIYLLEFADNTFYIGQAIDNVKRFTQHRKNYDNIVNYWFREVNLQSLDETERRTIQEAEIYGLLLTNKTYVSNIMGETDLDLIISPEQQQVWIEKNGEFPEDDFDLFSIIDIKHKIKYKQNFEKLKRLENYSTIKEILNIYIKQMLPAYKKTELSFWSLSCLPSTNKSTYPRYFCLNVNAMEVFVSGYNKINNEPYCFVNTSKNLFNEGDLETFTKKYKSLKIYETNYRAAGKDQICFEFSEVTEFMNALQSETKIIESTKELNLRLMRKGGTIYSPYHCFNLVNDVLNG